MDSSNQFCDFLNCSNPACKFVFMSSMKRRACLSHVSELAKKRLTIYDIDAFDFINSIGDAGTYEARRREVDAGLGNLTVLEAAYDVELRHVQESLEAAKTKAVKVVEASYAETKFKIERKYECIKGHMDRARRSLERFRLNKDAELSSTEQLLLKTQASPSQFFKISISDPSISLVKVIFSSWVYEAASDSSDSYIKSALEEQGLDSTENTKSPGTPGTDKKSVVRKKLVKLLEHSWDAEDVNDVASSYGRKAVEESRNRRFTAALRYWKKSLHLLRLRFPGSKQTAETSHQLGQLVLEQWSQYSEAETAFRQSLEIQQTLNPSSEETVKAINVLARVLIQEEMYKIAEQLLNRAVEICKAQKFDEGLCASLTSLALLYTETERLTEAGELMRKCDMDISNKEDRAGICNTMGLVLFRLQQYLDSEHHYKSALEVYKVYFPDSIQTAITLQHLGILYETMLRYPEAEQRYHDALVILMANFSDSYETALTLHSLGLVYQAMQRITDAELQFQHSSVIFKANFPNSIGTAKSLTSLGVIYAIEKRYKEAKHLFKEAKSIFEEKAPKSNDMANALYNLGKLYKTLQDIPKAISNIEAALMIWEENGSPHADKHASPALKILYSEKKRFNVGTFFKNLFD